MQWTKPDFQEITLGGELTAYVNTDEIIRPTDDRCARVESTGGPDSPRDKTA
jgi:coenzyme PQQ precursor peptide PqqA|tara:strand:+ start:556 stop:711 length:156 start_codon:yes stop_codon:yes gene_type:complete